MEAVEMKRVEGKKERHLSRGDFYRLQIVIIVCVHDRCVNVNDNELEYTDRVPGYEKGRSFSSEPMHTFPLSSFFFPLFFFPSLLLCYPMQTLHHLYAFNLGSLQVPKLDSFLFAFSFLFNKIDQISRIILLFTITFHQSRMVYKLS